MPRIRKGLSFAAIEQLINQRVADAMTAYEANRSNGNATQNEASGSAGVVGLTRWFEKMKYIFRISDCAIGSQVKFATRTLLDGALTWWNSHVQSIGIDKACEMSWKDLMKPMIEVYCLRNEIQKLESKLYNLSVKGTDVAGYTRRFQELSLLCPRMVPEEEDKIKRDADNKRKWGDEHEGNHRQQQNKRQEVGRIYVAITSNKTGYARNLPLYDKCKLHHHDPYPVKCGNYKKFSHQVRDCWTLPR
nr:hypothetical protein [Tanacetum cinerariifolium]